MVCIVYAFLKEANAVAKLPRRTTGSFGMFQALWSDGVACFAWWS
jgi:hypothetical protein